MTEVLRIPADAIEFPSEIITSNADSDYLMGIAKLDDKMVILLDLNKVLPEESIELLANTAMDTTGAIKEEATPVNDKVEKVTPVAEADKEIATVTA